MASKPAQGRDLINGPIGPTLLLFALPTLASSILQSLNGSINSIWIGRFLGEIDDRAPLVDAAIGEDGAAKAAAHG